MQQVATTTPRRRGWWPALILGVVILGGLWLLSQQTPSQSAEPTNAPPDSPASATLSEPSSASLSQTVTESEVSDLTVNDLSFVRTYRELGNLSPDAAVQAVDFEFVFRGEQPLTVESMDTFCSCLSAQIELDQASQNGPIELPVVIQPGMVGRVAASLDPSALEDARTGVSYDRLVRLNFANAQTAAFDLRINFRLEGE